MPANSNLEVFLCCVKWTGGLLLAQSVAEWRAAFALMTLAQRLAAHDLAFVTHGLEIEKILPRGISRYLEPQLVPNPNGCGSYLRSPHHRQLIQVWLSCHMISVVGVYSACAEGSVTAQWMQK